MTDIDNRPTAAAGCMRPIDPARPALEYLTLDRPRFEVQTGRDLDGDGWWIDEPGSRAPRASGSRRR